MAWECDGDKERNLYCELADASQYILTNPRCPAFVLISSGISSGSGNETCNVRNFSTKETAFNIIGLVHPILFSMTQVEPVWGELERWW